MCFSSARRTGSVEPLFLWLVVPSRSPIRASDFSGAPAAFQSRFDAASFMHEKARCRHRGSWELAGFFRRGSTRGKGSDDRLKRRAIRTDADKPTTANFPQSCETRVILIGERVAIVSRVFGTDGRSRNREWSFFRVALPRTTTLRYKLERNQTPSVYDERSSHVTNLGNWSSQRYRQVVRSCGKIGISPSGSKSREQDYKFRVIVERNRWSVELRRLDE